MAPLPFGTPAPTLSEDLAFVCSLSKEHLLEFCAAAVSLLRTAAPLPKMYANAAKLLAVEPQAVEHSVHALGFLLQRAATVGAPASRLLEGIDLPLSDELLQSLREFYESAQPELNEIVQRQPSLPQLQRFDWRLQVQLAGRYASPAPMPFVLMRLGVSAPANEPTEHLFQADLPNLRRLSAELEAAVREERSTHSRRIQRRM
ncbi:hypothetical protein AB1Y20_014033 [Prymnesium parvum]|uniref:COMM domain-containing protein n=1 Tax=Prymnesium parvum TaxID=97485 RepID=A0AB34IEN0_PRYPA